MSSSTKGVVLISILLIVLLLSSVAILFGNKYLLSLKRAQYIEFQSLSLNAFRNIEALSKEKIKKELRFNKNKISKNNPLLKESFYYNLNGADIVVRISDASNCLNIISQNPNEWDKMLILLKLKENFLMDLTKEKAK